MTVKNVAKVVVFSPEDKVLLLRRVDTDENRPGEWDFPGGGVEEGENIEEAVVREAKEEAGIDISGVLMQLVFARTECDESSDSSRNRLLFVAKLAVDQQASLSEEHDEYSWVSVDEALEKFPHPFYATGLRYAVENNLV